MPHSPITTLIGFSALILIFMFVTATTTLYVSEFKGRIAREELEAIGSSIAGQIVEALSLSESIPTGRSFLFRINMPDECALGHYDVSLLRDSNRIVLVLKPSSLPKPNVTVIVPISNSIVILESTISSGAKWNYIQITMAYDSIRIKLVYIRGD